MKNKLLSYRNALFNIFQVPLRPGSVRQSAEQIPPRANLDEHDLQGGLISAAPIHQPAFGEAWPHARRSSSAGNGTQGALQRRAAERRKKPERLPQVHRRDVDAEGWAT